MNLREIVTKASHLPIGDELRIILDLHEDNGYSKSVFKAKECKESILEFLINLNKVYNTYLQILDNKATNPDFSIENDLGPYLYKFNYETSLCFVSLLNILKRSNIEADDILNYYETLLKEFRLDDAYLIENDILKTVMNYARHNNVMVQIYNNPDVNLRPVSYYVPDRIDAFIKAGRIINREYLNLLIGNSWNITNRVIRSLELIPGDIEKDFQNYQNQIMEVWLHFFKLMDLLGHDADSIGRLYSVYVETLK